MVCMVEGNITVLTFDHAMTASKTGSLAGVAYALVGSRLGGWLAVFVTGLLVMISDLIAHPSHFFGDFGEAVITGLVAMLIMVLFDRYRK